MYTCEQGMSARLPLQPRLAHIDYYAAVVSIATYTFLSMRPRVHGWCLYISLIWMQHPYTHSVCAC